MLRASDFFSWLCVILETSITSMTLRPKVILAICIQFILLTNCGPRQGENIGSEVKNRLANASSPYLKEHADNPVDWYEWGAEALEKAKKRKQTAVHKYRLRFLSLVSCYGAGIIHGYRGGKNYE